MAETLAYPDSDKMHEYADKLPSEAAQI